MYLYILPFKECDVLKIGIAEDFKRIFYLNTVYPLDLCNAVAFTVNDPKAIRSMEGHLLAITQKHYAKQIWYRTSYKKKTYPGRSELRTKECIIDICRFLFIAEYLHDGSYHYYRYNYHKCTCCGSIVEGFKVCKELREVPIFTPTLKLLNFINEEDLDKED